MRAERSLVFAASLVAIFIPRATLAARPAWETVWAIGTFDGSSAEFNGGRAPTPAPPYVIGKSTPRKNWYAFQPGSRNGFAGDHPHPVSIEFNLARKPRGIYRLKIALLVERPRVSALDVDLNGRRGRFYQHPRLDDRMGDVACAFLPEYSSDTIAFDFPAKYLRRGSNQIILTAVDEPEPGDQPSLDGLPAGNSGLVYDALELEQDGSGRFSRKQISASVAPTIFYRKEGNASAELVDVFVRFRERPRRGSIELRLKGRTFSVPLVRRRAFGEQRAEFAVPEFPAPAAATVTVSLNGRLQRFSEELSPAKKWTIFVVPNEHLDVGYSDYAAKVAEIHARVLDEAMALIQKYPAFRWSLDGYWEAERFLDARSPQDQQKFFQMVEERKIFVPAPYASLLTGFPTLETLIRSLYPSFAFSREHHSPFDYASITDVPSYTWSYASILADAGLKYFVAGSDNYRAPVLLFGHLNEKSPFWWEGPDGSKILMWYSRHYEQVTSLFGMPPQIAAGHDSLPIFLQMYDAPEYAANAVLLYGTQVENTDLFPSQASLVGRWKQIYEYPRLQFSGFAHALRVIAKQPALPVVRGDGGPYWEDGIASDAYDAALERRNESRALSAEKFSTLTALTDPRLAPENRKLRRMWRQMVLMDEHTWGAWESVSNPASEESRRQLRSKDLHAVRARSLVQHILRRSMAALANSIADPPATLLVFNSLNWRRSGLVRFDLPRGWELVDKSADRPVACEVLSRGPSYDRIRFLAESVPPLGYKAYALEPGSPPAPTQKIVGTTLESPFYRVTLDPETGAVRSLWDRQLHEELVDHSSPYRLGQYVYVTGGDQLPNRLVQYRSVSPLPVLTPHPASRGRLISVATTPFGAEARLVSSAKNTPQIATTLLLFNREKKIEFIDHVRKDKVLTKEGVYFAFPFAMSHPEFHYEIQNGVVNPARDMLPGAGREWFSVQHWVSAGQNGVSAAVMPIDAPLVTLGDIVRGRWPRRFGERKGTIFSYVMNNYWDTNYRAAQGGRFTFRYVVTSSAHEDPADLSRMAWEEMTPLETDHITSQDKAIHLPRPLSGKEGSFLDVSDPDVLLVTWKVAEDRNGTILRFLEMGGRSSEVGVAVPFIRLASAWKCNAMEVNQRPLANVTPHRFSFHIGPHQIVTIRITGAATLAPPPP